MRSMFLNCFVLLLILSGCASTRNVILPAKYSYVQDETNGSSINFSGGNPGVYFISFNDEAPPKPKENTEWGPIVFPSGQELRIKVRAVYEEPKNYTGGILGRMVHSRIEEQRSIDTVVEFVCPPLEDGNHYVLSFIKDPGIPGLNNLHLVDTKTKAIIFRAQFRKN